MHRKSKQTIKQTKIKCPDCGSYLIIKDGKYGEFYGCSNFPNCKYSRSLNVKRISYNSDGDSGHELGSWAMVNDVYDQSDFY